MSLSTSSYPDGTVASLDGRYAPSRRIINKRPGSSSMLAINYFNSFSGRVQMYPAWVWSKFHYLKRGLAVYRVQWIDQYTASLIQNFLSLNINTRPLEVSKCEFHDQPTYFKLPSSLECRCLVLRIQMARLPTWMVGTYNHREE